MSWERRKYGSKLSRLYDFYTSDLSYKEIEKLIKRDVPELYNFYVKRMNAQGKPARTPRELFRFIRSLFIEFLYQLTPVRRLLYTIGLVLFI